MIQKFKIIVMSFIALFIVMTPVAVAAQSGTNTNTSTNNDSSGTCGETKTQFIQCDAETGVGTINELIKIVVNVLTVLIGVVATGGLAYAGVLYASARDNQSQVGSALTIIRNIVIGLFLYGFTIAIINWLIPGGVIG